MHGGGGRWRRKEQEGREGDNLCSSTRTRKEREERFTEREESWRTMRGGGKMVRQACLCNDRGGGGGGGDKKRGEIKSGTGGTEL